MSGTSLDGVDAVVADFAPAAAAALRAAGGRARPVRARPRRRAAARCSAPAPTSSRARRAPRMRWPTPMPTRSRAALGRAGLARSGRRRRRRARPDAAPPSRRRLDAAAQQSGARRRAGRHGGRRRFPQPRRRRRRAGRAAGAGLPRRAVRRRRASRRRQSSAASPTSPTCRRTATVRGFDTGPGNVLLDLWHARHRGAAFDRDGAWARTGRVDAALLAALLAEPYFARVAAEEHRPRSVSTPSGSTRGSPAATIAPADVQATLVALTARTIADADRDALRRRRPKCWSAAAARTTRR